MRALTILSGSFTGSPRLILSTFSMPSMTLPQTVYWRSRKRASAKQMKNWLLALFGATPVLNYSRFIHAIEPEGGQALDGMQRISPAQVMRRIEPYLNVTK